MLPERKAVQFSILVQTKIDEWDLAVEAEDLGGYLVAGSLRLDLGTAGDIGPEVDGIDAAGVEQSRRLGQPARGGPPPGGAADQDRSKHNTYKQCAANGCAHVDRPN